MRDALAGEAQTGLARGRSALPKKCGLLSAVSSVFFAQYFSKSGRYVFDV
jgi:hypothetical protein